MRRCTQAAEGTVDHSDLADESGRKKRGGGGGGGGCCSSAATVDNVKWVEERAGVTRPNVLKLLVTAQLLDISQTSRYRIVLDELGYRKLPARLLPKQLSDDHKKQRLGVAEIC